MLRWWVTEWLLMSFGGLQIAPPCGLYGRSTRSLNARQFLLAGKQNLFPLSALHMSSFCVSHSQQIYLMAFTYSVPWTLWSNGWQRSRIMMISCISPRCTLSYVLLIVFLIYGSYLMQKGT